jgi:hypothetical protein
MLQNLDSLKHSVHTPFSDTLNQPEKVMRNPVDEGSYDYGPSNLPMGFTVRKRTPTKGLVSDDHLQFPIRLPGREKASARARSISFDENVRMIFVPSLVDLNAGNTKDIWFQPDEFDTIRRKTLNLVLAIQQGRTGGVNYCTRGLEKYFNAGEVYQRILGSRNSVLCEQERQRLTCCFDDVRLSHACKHYSSQSMAEAAYRGKMDEKYIARYIQRLP